LKFVWGWVKSGEIIGGPPGTVPELLFEKEGLIPAIQRLLIKEDSISQFKSTRLE